MEESSPPKLHDSLDLTALRAEIAAEQHKLQNQRKRGNYYYLTLVGVIVLMAFSSVGGSFSTTLAIRTLYLAQLVLLACVILYFIPRAISQYRAHQLYAVRLDAYAPAFIPRVQRAETMWIVLSWTLVIVLSLGAQIFPDITNILIVLAVAWLIRSYASRRLMRWAHEGDIQRIEKLMRFLPANPLLVGYKAAHQIGLNRLDESAQGYRNLLARKSRRDLYAIPYWLNNLGLALTYSEHYAEALPTLEAVVRLKPNLENGYQNLAVWYLDQGLDSERALELSEIALELAAPQDDTASPFIKAICARALMLTGRSIRAQALLDQAMKASKEIEPSARAELEREIGYTVLAQNNRDAALEHFKTAVELDPDGIYGKLAQRALDSV